MSFELPQPPPGRKLKTVIKVDSDGHPVSEPSVDDVDAAAEADASEPIVIVRDAELQLLKDKIKDFIGDSDDDGGMKPGVKPNVFIRNLLSIWRSLSRNIKENCIRAYGVEAAIPDNFKKYLEQGALVNLIITALEISSDDGNRTYLKKEEYGETVRNFLLDYFSQIFSTIFGESASELSKEELLKAIVGFYVPKKKSDNGLPSYEKLGFVEIHCGVGSLNFWGNKKKYCDGIKKICEKLDDLGIRFLVSSNVNKECYDGKFTLKEYTLALPNAVTTRAVTHEGGSSLRRRKVYKPSRISRKPRKSHKTRRTKPKTKKQYRRKRYTKRCKKSHRRSRH
jgi:hypothetical protein